jgi:hypothetical protein
MLTLSDDPVTISNIIIRIIYNVLKQKDQKLISIKEHYLIN